MKQFVMVNLFLAATLNLSAQLPSADSVLFKLYSEYEAETGGNTGWNLARTPRGYEIYSIDYSDGKPVYSEMQLFYSAEKRTYSEIGVTRRKMKITNLQTLSEKGMQLRFGDRYGFERCPYYGYPQWSWDVIQEFAQKPELTDLELEGLSRAYQNYSQGYVWGSNSQFEANAGWPSRNFTAGDSLPPGNIDSFLFYARLETETIQRLVNRNPGYQVIVGSIANKLANEYMDVALNLAEYGYYNQALEYVKMAKYEPSMVTYARNYLNIAPSKAILFTDGDNDSYPVWWVQIAENYRRDVTVINLSLLPLNNYNKMFTSGQSPFGRIKANAFAKAGRKLGYFAYEAGNDCPATDSSFSAGDLIEFYYKRVPENDAAELPSEFPCRNISVQCNGQTMGYRLNTYFHAGDVMMFDIIQSTALPVYYTYTGENETKNWGGRIEKGNGFLVGGGGLDRDYAAITDWYLNIYEKPKPSPGSDLDTDATSRYICSHYMGQLSEAIQWAYDQKEKDKLTRLTDLAIHIFPDGKMHPSANWGTLAAALLYSRQEKPARSVIEYLKNDYHKTEYQEILYRNQHPNEKAALDNIAYSGHQLIELRKWLDEQNLYSEINHELLQFLEAHPVW